MHYYARIARHVLPAVADRPLVMKRFPNGVRSKAFYQQRGKAVASVYSVRAEPQPTVSTALEWRELTDDLDPSGMAIPNSLDGLLGRG